MKDAGQEQLIIDILLKRKEDLLKKHKKEHPNESLRERLENLKCIQDQDGYMPEIENKDGFIHFRELNCPYIEVAKEFPQICHAERGFIQEFIEADIVTLSSMVDGHTCCHYTVKEK